MVKKQSWIREWWWTIAFLAVSSVWYGKTIVTKNAQIAILKDRLESMEKEKKQMMAAQEELLLQKQSQDDPEWVEMILMKKLGLAPEGKQKVYFRKP